MPIRNQPFVPQTTWEPPKPMLWIRIFNAHMRTTPIYNLALIDTGADRCVFPSQAAVLLGHQLKNGQAESMWGVTGSARAYEHKSHIEVLNTLPDGSGRCEKKVLFSLKDVPIQFVDDYNFRMFILGVDDFLNKFVLNIDYPNEIFSLTIPDSKKK